MKVKLIGIYICELCGNAFKTDQDHEKAITGFKRNSNGRHIAKEYSRNSEKHICYYCIDSIRDDECNFN